MSDKLKVYKSKKLNNAGFDNLTLTDYQIFLNLVSLIKGIDESGNYIAHENLERSYTLSAHAYAKLFNVEINNAYNALKKSAKKLMKTSIKTTPDLFNVETEINICSQAKYKNNQGEIAISFSPEIMPYLAQVKKKFMYYDIKEIANFRSIYSTRLYELIQEYKQTGWITKSVEDLKKMFSIENKYNEYRDFKKRCITKAVNEINELYPTLLLYFTETKENRKVVKLDFHFVPIRTKQFINPITQKPKNIYTKHKQKKIVHKVVDIEPTEVIESKDDISKTNIKELLNNLRNRKTKKA